MANFRDFINALTSAINARAKKTELDAVVTSLNTKQDQLGFTPIDIAKIGALNGVASLDSSGKIPASQLPNTVMELKGPWDASSNTPTLINGVGDPGDIYEVTVEGAQDFGAGSIIFKVGDFVVYGSDNKYYNSPNTNEVVSVAGKVGMVTLDKADVGLDNVKNVDTTDPANIVWNESAKTVSDTQISIWDSKQASLGFTPEDSSNKGVANGYPSLDANGLVPSNQLPSYVDDVLEGTYVNSTIFNKPTTGVYTGETGKIYVDTATNKSYRWSGSAYIEVSSGAIASIAGKTGVVTLDTRDVAEAFRSSTLTSNYSLTNTDNGLTIECDNTSDIIITVPTTLSDLFSCVVIRKNTGNVTFAAGSGLTLLSSGGKLKISAQYDAVSVLKKSNSVTYLIGSLA